MESYLRSRREPHPCSFHRRAASRRFHQDFCSQESPMNHSSRPRMMSKLSESTQRRLQAYELAATAAGVGMLALAPCSEAKIIYSPAHKILNTGSQYKLD